LAQAILAPAVIGSPFRVVAVSPSRLQGRCSSQGLRRQRRSRPSTCRPSHAMVAANIKVFVRVRPSARPSKGFSAKVDDGTLAFELEKTSPEYQVNNTKTGFTFRFDGILSMTVTQEAVFDNVAKPVVDDVLQGINGTIFAYGQTGSGKTFTITGGTERYADRGLIPRTISYLFEAFQRGDATYRLYVSYLEIYNDSGYDLLSRDDSTQKLEDLPKVQLREDEDGNIHLRNLSVNTAQSEEDALNLLFLGDTNRVVAETPMNDASTRSHCMFILWIDSTQRDSDTVRRAKLHLVDLAGSERISRTGVEGNLQKEAKYINLSLHYLEQVIVALQERSQGRRAHVPYRNSMMTSVLRDSLGGNCKTVMVGTMAAEDNCVEESMSTCRFAQRVASIKNNASVNEELDPALLIKRLKKQVAELKDELKLLNSSGDEEEAEDISGDAPEECRKLVSSYLEEPDPDALFVCGSAARFRECFHILRQVYLQRQAKDPALAVADQQGTGALCPHPHKRVGGADEGVPPVLGGLEATVIELRGQVTKRDEEIAILVSSLSKRSRGKGEAQAAMKDGRVFIRGGAQQPSRPGKASSTSTPEPNVTMQDTAASGGAASAPSMSPPTRTVPSPSSPQLGGTVSVAAPTHPADAPADPQALLLDRNKAFEVFRKSVRRSETLEDNREVIRKLLVEAKSLGEKANAARELMNGVKKKVEKVRIERAMTNSPQSTSSSIGVLATTPQPDGPEVCDMLREVDDHKRVYQLHTQRLRQVKEEIDSFQRSAEENKLRLQRDFESWYMSLQAHQGATGGALPDDGFSGASPARLAGGAVASGTGTTLRSASLPPSRAAGTELPSPVPVAALSTGHSTTGLSSCRRSSEGGGRLGGEAQTRGSSRAEDRGLMSAPRSEAWAPRPAAAAGEPFTSSSTSASPGPSSSSASRRTPPPLPQATPAGARNVGAAAAGPDKTKLRTGDAETDNDIERFLAAMAELGRR